MIKLPTLRKHEGCHMCKYILGAQKHGHWNFVQCELIGKRQHYNYDVSVKQRLDLKSLTSQRPEIQSLKQFTLQLSSLSCKLKPSPIFDMRPLPQLCSTMNSKSLPAVPVGAHHQRGVCHPLAQRWIPCQEAGA